MISGNTCQSNVGGSSGGCLKVPGSGGDRTATPGNSNNGQITNNSIIQNTSGYGGGGVHIGAGKRQLDHHGNTIQDNFTSTAGGGGIRSQENGFHHTITGNTFEGNSSYEGQGGALKLASTNSSCGNGTTISNNIIRYNNANGGTDDSSGGGLWASSNNSCMAFSGNTWTQNSGLASAGAIEFDPHQAGGGTSGSQTGGSTNALVTFANETFVGNNADCGEHGGGAISFSQGMPGPQSSPPPPSPATPRPLRGRRPRVQLRRRHIRHALSPRVTLSNLLFVNNKAGDDDGGAIYTEHDMDSLRVLTSVFQGNQAGDSYGGAIMFDTNTSPGTSTSKNVLIRDSQFVGNSAEDDGGAIMLDQNMQGLQITGTGSPSTCTPVSVPPFTAPTCSLFQGNFSEDDGGAIASEASPLNSTGEAPVSINNTLFLRNSAESDGGAIGLENGEAPGLGITGNIFRGNTSGSDGGAIELGTTNSDSARARSSATTSSTATRPTRPARSTSTAAAPGTTSASTTTAS